MARELPECFHEMMSGPTVRASGPSRNAIRHENGQGRKANGHSPCLFPAICALLRDSTEVPVDCLSFI
jgi:hypothetical protein